MTLEQDLHVMTARSQTLQRLLRSAGYGKGSGVSAAGCTLVKRIAAKRGLRDWTETQTAADYDALIAAVREHFGMATE